MKARIQLEGLPVPVTQAFADILIKEISKELQDNMPPDITLNFRDPTYSAEAGGFHPVEVRLELVDGQYQIQYITDFAYVGQGWCAELAKEIDFDFSCKRFEMLYMPPTPITDVGVSEVYSVFEANFISYFEMGVFNVTVQ